MEKPVWVVSIDNEIKGYVNSFEEGLDYIKQIGWLDENYNTWQDWLEDFDEEEKEKYPTFDDLYNMPEKDRRDFWYLFDGALDIFEIDKLIVTKE